MKIHPDVQKEIQRKQEKQLKNALKLLSGSQKKALNTFLESGQSPASKDFKALKPNVQKIVLKMNITSMDIVIERTKNPFARWRYKLARLSSTSLLKNIS
ncbi:MAG: hypothetical protein JXA95_07380 [Spirochaetales bacterium]|nr:hypothetical protein [Spirochaetales bacterium]